MRLLLQKTPGLTTAPKASVACPSSRWRRAPDWSPPWPLRQDNTCNSKGGGASNPTRRSAWVAMGHSSTLKFNGTWAIKPLSLASCPVQHSWLTHLCNCKEGFVKGTWCMVPYIYRFPPFKKPSPVSHGGHQWEVSAFAVSNAVLREAMLLNRGQRGGE